MKSSQAASLFAPLATMRVVVLSLALVSVACQATDRDAPAITGAGATFPAPLYQRWINRYAAETGAKVVYRSEGSRKGIEAVMLDNADFGSSDSPMTDDELAQAGDVLHLPATLGSVAVVYNLPDAPDELKLTSDVLADVFLGVITRWNDPRMAALNAGESLPDLPISVVFRSEGSGTTQLFTAYLAKTNPAWAEQVGTGTSVKWPTGVGAVGNDGVAQLVQRSRGTLSYVALSHARTLRLRTAALRNRAGAFVLPSLDSTTAAAAQVSERMPADLRISIVDADGDASYPIAGFSYALVRKDAPEPARRRAIAKFLWWALHEGQPHAPFLHYATLPPEVVTKAEQRLKLMTAEGRPVLQ